MVRRKNTDGFTVIEVLVGIGLFGIVMPSIIIAVVGVSKLNDRAADLSRANILAEQKIETLRSQGYNTLTDGTVDFTDELNPTFTAPRSATYTVISPTAGYKEIQVDIKYTVDGNEKLISFRSLMSELGVSQ
jgi:type II secretory pathway pseudopilin PulG